MPRINMVCCRPEPIARVMRLFPKLALLFLVVHVAAMIYSVLKPHPMKHKAEIDTPPGVVDVKMRNIADRVVPIIDSNLEGNASHHGDQKNKTKSILLNKIQNGRKLEGIIEPLKNG